MILKSKIGKLTKNTIFTIFGENIFIYEYSDTIIIHKKYKIRKIKNWMTLLYKILTKEMKKSKWKVKAYDKGFFSGLMIES